MKKHQILFMAVCILLFLWGCNTDSPSQQNVTQYLVEESYFTDLRTGITSSTIYTYSSSNHLEYTTVYQNGTESYRMYFTCDENGYPISGEAELGDAKLTCEMTYDAVGNMLSSKTYQTISGKKQLISSESNTYGEDSKLMTCISKAYSSASGDIMQHTKEEYTYNSDGLAIKYCIYDELNGIESSYSLYCDAAGNPVLAFSDEYGIIIYSCYDDAGNLITKETYYPNEFVSFWLYSYVRINETNTENPQNGQSAEVNDDVTQITSLLDAYEAGIKSQDNVILAQLFPETVSTLLTNQGSGIIDYFEVDVASMQLEGNTSANLSIREITYHCGEPYYSYMDSFFEETGIAKGIDNTAAVIVEIENEPIVTRFVILLYKHDGKWCYYRSLSLPST